MIIIFLIILLFMSVIIDIKILKDNDNDKIILEFKTLFELIKYKIEIPFIDLTMKKNGLPFLKMSTEIKKGQAEELSEEKKSIVNLNEMKKIYKKVRCFFCTYEKEIQYICSRLKISTFLWKTDLGLKDAALTGMLSGVLWIFQEQIIILLRNNAKCNQMNSKVTPHFNKEVFKTTLHCIIKGKIGYIIIAGIKFGWTFLIKDGECDG
ncbi:MAG: DUF2953 domain-containing protein [Marinisporobacter sp.]|nr:DUF2953 domain-containing protein [Marinisporobacter sp.]